MNKGKSIWSYDLFDLLPFRVRVQLRVLRPRTFRARALARLFRELALFARHGLTLDRALAAIATASPIRPRPRAFLSTLIVFMIEGWLIVKLVYWLVLEKPYNPVVVIPAALVFTAFLFLVQLRASLNFGLLIGFFIILIAWSLSFPVWFFIIPFFIVLLIRLDLTNSMINYSRFMRLLARTLHRRMLSGLSLCEAMKRDPRMFSDYEIAMVKTGEQSGRLPEMLMMLAGYERRRGRFIPHAVANLLYPMVLGLYAAFIVWFLLVTIIPKLEEIYSTLGASLPEATRVLVRISDDLRAYSVYYGIAILIAWLLFSVLRHYWRMPELYLPPFRKICPPLFASRFLLSIGYQLQAGITLPEACKNASGIARTRAMRNDFLKKALGALERGHPLSTALERIDWFPRKALRFISLSEFADTLDKRLIDIAQILADDSEQHLLRTTKWLEPVAHFCVAMVIAFTIVSLYLPLFTIPKLIR